MERAGAEDMPEDAERKGLGTPATRAAILEKLVAGLFCIRKPGTTSGVWNLANGRSLNHIK